LNLLLQVDCTSMSFWERGGWNNTGLYNPWFGQGNNAPFDQEFYFVLNVAVGGTSGYFLDGVGGKPWTNTDPHAVNAFWNAQAQWYPSWQQNASSMQIGALPLLCAASCAAHPPVAFAVVVQTTSACTSSCRRSRRCGVATPPDTLRCLRLNLLRMCFV
jgi:hypothetical protein